MIRPILIKKGDFTASILSTIVSVAGILLIGFLAVKLYNFFISQDEKNAAQFLDSIQGKIEALQDNENNTFPIRGVEDWVLVAWDKSVASNDKPQKCFDKNCLCLCKKLPDKDTCQKEGICRFADEKISVSSKLREESSYKRLLKIADYSATCAYTYDELMTVFISRDLNLVSLIVDYGILKDTNEKHRDLIYNGGNIYGTNEKGNPIFGKLRAIGCNFKDNIIRDDQEIDFIPPA